MPTFHNATRLRVVAAIATALTVAAGLAVRRLLPAGFWSKYSGVALWAIVVYSLVLFIRPRIGVVRCASIALLISWSVEFAQLTPVPAWLSSKHAVLRLIFGESFSIYDLPAYTAGILAAAILHASFLRRSQLQTPLPGRE